MLFSPNLWIVLGAVLLSFILAALLTRKWRIPDYYAKVWLVLFCFLTSAAVCWVGWPDLRLGIDLRGGVNLVYELAKGRETAEETPGAASRAATRAEQEGKVDMDQLIAAISRRINPGGQKEITIRRFGPGQIEIIVPTVRGEGSEEEVARIKKKISSVGTLEFRITANPRDHKFHIDRARALSDRETRVYGEKKADDEKPTILAWWVPVTEGREDTFVGGYTTRVVKQRGKDVTQVLVVNDPFNVTGQYLVKAAQSYDEKGRPDVTFAFNATGAALFGRLTSANLPDPAQDFYRHLGIVLDGSIYSAPRIQSAIYSHGQISGDFTQKEAQDLVDVLNAGALPAALNDQPISELRTGPTLGSDTIEKGTNAILLSTGAVFVFMLYYYRFSGIVACAAVIMNMTMLVAVMIAIKAAFTLPGLAGIALTVAMAVDANVLIYERIREELEKQTSLRMAIRNGFGRAMSAIVDSNLTTIISGVVLYAVGTDQIKGFAVTLTLGVAASLFTAVFCAHVVFDVAERQRWITRLKMLRMFAKTNIDFYGLRKGCYAASSALIVIGLVAVFYRGKGLLDIDFTGGVSVQVVFKEAQPTQYLRDTLQEALPELVVSEVQSADIEAGHGFIINTASPPDTSAEDYLNRVKHVLKEKFGDKLLTNTVAIKPAEAGGEKPSGAKTSDRRRGDLPPDTMLASADPAPLLLAPGAVALAPSEKMPAEAAAPAGQPAEKPKDPPTQTPAEKPAPKLVEKPAEKPGEKSVEKPAAPPAEAALPAEKPADKPPEKPADKPAEARPAPTAAEKTEWLLDFTQKVNHATLEELIREPLETGKFGPTDAEIRLFNEQYEEGSEEPFYHWTVTVGLPQARAEGLLAAVQEKLLETPYFPASNTIGGKVAGSTRVQAMYAILISNLLIMIYLWIRFERLAYGLAAVVALVHDVLIALGLLALSFWLSKFLGFLLIQPFKIGLTEIAAFLTLVGFSVNDTVVVFDRIREVKGKLPNVTPEIINTSINQTLARTVLTSLTVMLVVLVLYILGGPTIHAFAFAMVVGTITGVYSSVYVAAPLLLFGRSEAETKQAKSKTALPVS